MKTPKSLLPAGLLLCLVSSAVHSQVLWYENQDGSNGTANPTIATQILPLSNRSTASCYFWSVNGDDITWKISKTSESGAETKTIFFTGAGSQTDIRRGRQNSLYVLTRSFPQGQDPEYKLYKLDTNLVIRKQYQLVIPGTFSINTINAFETDIWDNVYVAGDGQYPDGPGFHPASFVIKTNKNLDWKWNYLDSVQTSFSHLHVNAMGIAEVIQDYYGYFPDLHISRLAPNGHLLGTRTLHTSDGRLNLQTLQDPDENIYIYGSQSDFNGGVNMYLYKISGFNGQTIYLRNYQTSADVQVNDLKADDRGNLFSLVTMYDTRGAQQCRVSKIRSWNGQLYWNKTYSFAADSCVLNKLVVDGADRFYAVGNQQRSGGYNRALAVRIRKSGQNDGAFPAPDSTQYGKLHGLSDGLLDRNNRLVAIGTTYDLDPVTQSNTYFRSFAVAYGSGNNGCNNKQAVAETIDPKSELEVFAAEDQPVAPESLTQKTNGNETPLQASWSLYPNPVTDQLHVTGLDPQQQPVLTVYTMSGVRVQQFIVTGRSLNVDTRSLPAGMYILSGGVSSLKFAVKH